MTRRPAVTLIEVLIAMFIMAIGMLALLVLFPLGAISMGQALKDDRCASTAAMADNVAIVQNVRGNTPVTTGLAYVDPYGVISGLGNLGNVIPRLSPGFITTAPNATYATDRWFSLPDDMTFLPSGSPDTSSGFIDRGRRYSYAYLLRQAPSPLLPSATLLVQMFVVVYSGRPVNTLTAETTYTAPANPITVVPPNALIIANTITTGGTTIKRGGWILDPNQGYFYRVTNITDSGGSTTVEVQTNLVGTPTEVTVMDYVAEVFDKGTSWQP